jgi:transposase
LVFRLHYKRIVSAEVIDFLGQLLRHHARRHLVVVMDRAPLHVSKATVGYVTSQVRLHLFYLPLYSPDWNPDEKVWNHLKHQKLKRTSGQDQGLASRTVGTKAQCDVKYSGSPSRHLFQMLCRRSIVVSHSWHE